MARRPNYGFEKQLREQKKQQKKKEKAERRASEQAASVTPDDGTEGDKVLPPSDSRNRE